MITIRLVFALKFDHFDIPAGTIISVPAEIARVAIQRGIGIMAEPERAVIEPQEKRVKSYSKRDK